MLAVALLGIVSAAKAEALPAPTNQSAISNSPTTINLSWSEVSGAAGYKIYRNSSTTPLTTVNTNSFIDSGLTPATLYSYYLSSFDASNTESILSGIFSATTQSDTSDPSIPAGLAATAVSSSQINLSWSAATDNVGVTGYNIFRNGSLIATTSGLNYSDKGLLASTTYSYTVAAYDAANHVSGESAAVTAVTFVATPDSTIPTVPTNLTAKPVSASQINLSWTASTDNVRVIGYRIFRNGNQIATTVKTYYYDKKLTADTAYTYSVSAFDEFGNVSSASAGLTVATLKAGQTINGNVAVQIINGDKKGKTVNYRSNEIIKLAVLSGKDFSARSIVNNSVLLGGAKPIAWSLKDINKDGVLDRIYSFKARNFSKINAEQNTLVFSAVTKDGKQIYATITVKVKNAPDKYRPVIEKKIKELQNKINELKKKLSGTDQESNVPGKPAIKNAGHQEIKKDTKQDKR